MTDLPNYLPGVPPMYGIKQPSPEFNQGNDIVVPVALMLDGAPLNDATNWLLEVFVKKSLKAMNILWHGAPKVGLFQQKEGTNLYFFRLPHDASALFLPGTYFYTVRGTQKPATGTLFDRMANLAQGTFAVVLDASAPNPKLSSANIRTTIYDPYTSQYVVTVEHSEITEPEGLEMTSQ